MLIFFRGKNEGTYRIGEARYFVTDDMNYYWEGTRE